jgi:DNA polymerase-3 subunit alpha (Gram-positive type)
MSSYFSKISDVLEIESIKKLCEYNNIDYKTIDSNSAEEMPADFIILNHLIPEQYVIYPLKTLHHKLELVFRYPTHQNKLVQYINSKSARLAQGKMKADHLNPMISNFMVQYLKTSNDFLTINRENHKIANPDIQETIEKFIMENVNDYKFPQTFL